MMVAKVPGCRPWRSVAVALVLGSTSLYALAAPAGCKVKQVNIPVRIVDQRPIATLTLNGVEMPMLVDSGAFFSMLSASTAAQLKLNLRKLPDGMSVEGAAGKVDAKLTRVEKVGFLGSELSNVDFIVGGNELGAGIMGILGRSTLATADTEYDLAHGMVRLSFPTDECDKANLAYWAGGSPVVVVPLDYEHHRVDSEIRLEVHVNGTRTLALLDTGATQTSVSLKVARSAGIAEADMKPEGRVLGAGEGRAKSWSTRIDKFELGGEQVLNSRMEVDDTDSADHGMLIGLDYFLSHRIYVSRLQRQVYVTWNGGNVFALGRDEPSKFDARYASLPQDVGGDDADALARRGAAAVAAGNYKDALDDLNRACALAPSVADHFFARARLHILMREPRLALADLDETLRLEPLLAGARYRRAWLRSSLGDRTGAQADLAQLDATLPPTSALRADMAEIYARFEQVPEALRQFGLWVDAHPKDERLANVLNSRCWLRTQRNVDLPLALKDCKEAVDRDDGASAYLDSLGWVYLRLGDAMQAKKAFDKAIKMDVRPFPLYGRGLAQVRLGDTVGSERDFAAARKLSGSIDADVRNAGFEFSGEAGAAAGSGS